jgi:hypothetical protein
MPKTAPFDPDAQAFITAAGITNPTQQSAINTLVVDLKGYNIWTKFKAIYPIVGGSASSHAVNLKTPGTYNMSFATGVTHSSTGMISGGAGYADTNLNQSLLSQNSTHLSFYSRTNLNANQAEIGIHAGNYNLMQIRVSGTGYYLINTPGLPTVAEADSRGFFIGNRQASNDIDAWKKGVKILNGTTASGTVASGNLFLLAYNNIQGGGGAAAVSTKQCAFASIGDGLTDTEAANFYTAVQAYQTTLGRSIGTQTVSDPDAQAFINAAVIDDQVQANAINQLVVDLKGYNIWTKMKALYPFVGGTAAQHKWNLKDPRDLDAAFRLVFNGGWTHSANGALPNGTNAYADTFFVPFTHLGVNSNSLGYYSGSNLSETNADPCNMGAFYLSTQAMTLLKSNVTLASRLNGALISYSTTTMRGFFSASKQSSTLTDIYLNGSQVGTGNSGGTLPINKVLLANISIDIGSNPYSGYVKNDFRFAYLSDGLTDTEAANYYTAVQTFQTTLGRNV